jgi:hypothetical protein
MLVVQTPASCPSNCWLCPIVCVCSGLFSHFLALRLQESIPPNRQSALCSALPGSVKCRMSVADSPDCTLTRTCACVWPSAIDGGDLMSFLAVSALVSYHCAAPGPDPQNGGAAASSSSSFPSDVPNFVFPDLSLLRRMDSEEYPSEEAFTFVLTDEAGNRTYGYTRRFLPVGSAARYPEALCILSAHAWPALFHDLLEHLHIRWLLQPGAAFAMLEAALQAPLPKPGHLFYLSIGSNSNSSSGSSSPAHPPVPGASSTASSVAQRPVEHFVLSRAEDVSSGSVWPLSPSLARWMSLDNAMLLLSALLCEQKIVFVSKHLPKLSECVHAAVGLLGPLEWTHMLVPLLPRHLLPYCSMPMPFLVGLHADYLQDLLDLPGLTDEIILVHLDRGGRVSSSHDVHAQVRAVEPGEEILGGRFSFPLPDGIAPKLRKQLKELNWSTQGPAFSYTSAIPVAVAMPVSADAPVAAVAAAPASTVAAVAASGVASTATSESSSQGSSSSSSNKLPDNQSVFEALLTFYLQLFAHVDWQQPLDSRGKFDMDAFLALTERAAPHLHDFLANHTRHSQAVERFLQQGCEKHHVASGGGRGNTTAAATAAVRRGNSITLAERFERLRLEVLSASAASTPSAPLQDTFSFSFVLKRVHAHLDAYQSAVASQASLAITHAVGTALPRFNGEAETRKLALELTSNSPFNPAAGAHKGRSARDVLALLTLATFDSRALGPVLNVIWDRLADCKKKNYLHAHKALVMLEFMVQHGSDRVTLASLGSTQSQTVQLLAYSYFHDHERTQQLIRSVASGVNTLLNNVFLLRKTRRYAAIVDLRKYAYHGAAAGKGRHHHVASSATAGSKSTQQQLLLVDPQYDEFRHRSLVEALLPALPPFTQLHARYRTEFDQIALRPHCTRAGEEEDSAAELASPAAAVGLSPTRRPADGGPASLTHAQAAAKPGSQFFDFSGLSGMDSAGFSQQPELRAIMSPAATAAVAVPVAQQSRPQQQVQPFAQPEFSGTILLAPTAMALMPPASSYAPSRSTQHSPALPMSTRSPAPTSSAPPPASASVAPPARVVSAGPSNLVHAAIIDTSIFEAAVVASPPKPVVSAPPATTPPASAIATVAAASQQATAAPSAAITAAAPGVAASAVSSDPWAAFDDAFADGPTPSPSPIAPVPTPSNVIAAAAAPVAAATLAAPVPGPASAVRATSAGVPTTTSSAHAPSPSVPSRAASAALPAAAASAEVDPTVGLDLFFMPAPPPPATAVVAPAAATAMPSSAAGTGVVGGGSAASVVGALLPRPPPISDEEAAAVRRRKEKAAAKRAQEAARS